MNAIWRCSKRTFGVSGVDEISDVVVPIDRELLDK